MRQHKQNPFNSLHDPNYKYTDQDVNWISKGFFQLYNYNEYTEIPPQQISDDYQILSLIQPFFQQLHDQPIFIPFDIKDKKWVFITLLPSKNLSTLIIYFDLQVHHVDLEAKLQELEKAFEKEYGSVDFRLNPTGAMNSALLSDDFLALRSEEPLNNQGITIFNLSKTPAESAVLRKELANVYKDAIMREIIKAPDLQWKDLDLKSKAEILKELQPCSPAQFDKICQGTTDLQTEASFLLKESILKPDIQLVKTILKAGLKINKGFLYKGISNLSFWTLAQEQMEQSLEPQVFQTIQELLRKYGCSSRDENLDVLKNKTLAIVFNEISVLFQAKKEALEAFYKLLKEKLSTNKNFTEASIYYYSLGVLKYAGEEISHAIKTSETEKLKMANKYTNLFFKFLAEGGAATKKPAVNLGAYMCKILFEVNKPTLEEINAIQEETTSHNKIVLAKILMLIQDLSHTRNTLKNLKAFSENVYEHSSQSNSRRSVILANDKNIIIAVHFEPKADSKNFYEKAEYSSSQTNFGLGKIIQDLILRKFRQAHLYILGNKYSLPFITEFIKEKLCKTFQIKTERLQIYIFGEIQKPDVGEIAKRTHMETLAPQSYLHLMNFENNHLGDERPQPSVSAKENDVNLILEGEWMRKIQPCLQQPGEAKKLLFLAISKGKSDIVNYLANTKQVPFEIDTIQNYMYLCEALTNGHQDILERHIQIDFKKLPFLKTNNDLSGILRSCLPLDNLRKPSYFSWSNFEKYNKIISFREQILNFNAKQYSLMTTTDYENILRDLQSHGWSKLALSSIFVSECLRAEEALQLKTNNQARLQYLKQFFEAQPYNKAVRYLLGFESDRFEKVLEICSSDIQEPDFIILKILTYLRKATAHFCPLEKRHDNLEIAKALLLQIDQTSSEFWYLQGEIWSAQKAFTNQVAKSDQDIQECYIKALGLNPFMYQAWIQLLNILFKQGKTTIAQKGCEMLSQEPLSLDTRESLFHLTEALSTQDYLKLLRQKKSEEKDFQARLKEALILDVEATLHDLLEIMPSQIQEKYKKMLVNEICPSFWHRKKSGGQTQLLEQVKQHSENLCTITEHFNNQETRKNRYYYLLNQLIDYYRSSIQDLIPQNQSVQVLSEKKDRLLFREEALNNLGNKLSGVHQVVPFPPKGDQQIYYKLNPYAPGIEFAVASLYAKILPNLVPETFLLQLSKGNQTFICQASKGVQGINFAQVVNQPKMVQKIDIKNFSALFLSSLLARPGDAKPDNFIMQFQFDQRGILSTQLFSIDNDIAFSREIFFNNSHKTIYSDMLNILFLLPQMDRPVSPYVREHIKNQSPAVLVAEWLEDLHKKNLQYQSAGFNKEFLTQAKLPIQLSTGTAKRIYQQLQAIKQLLLENENLTHQDIFKAICPSIYNFYKTSRDETNIVNSLKSMYAAAGASPILVSSDDFGIQKQVWKTLSGLHMKDRQDFTRVFSQSVQEAAEELLSTIDFRSFDSEKMILEIAKKLANFVENLQLNHITPSQFDILCQKLKIKNLTLIDPILCPPQTDLDSLKLSLKKKYGILAEVNITNNNRNNEEEEENLKSLKSIWDIFKICHVDVKELKKEIMEKRKKNIIDINQQDNSGNTALHHAIKNQDQLAVEILLDCGIDHTIRNNNNQSVVDLMDSLGCSDEIRLCVTNKDLDFAWELINDNKYEQVEILFQTLCKERVDDFRDAFFDRNEDELLNTSFKDRLWKGVALCLIKRVSTIKNPSLIHLCINNYEDLDLYVLIALVEKNGNRREIINYPDQNNNNLLPADLAFIQKKYSMLSYLVNQGAQMTDSIIDENAIIILKAARWGLRIDETDFENQFDYTKIDQKGKTIFHYMCVHRDKDVLKRYPDILSENSKHLETLALQNNFVEWFEYSYQNLPDEKLYDNEGHTLAKGPNKKLTKILRDIFGIKVSIQQAIQGVDFNAQADDKGNTLFQRIVKKFIKINQNKFLDIFTELLNGYEINLNQTFRSDKSTVLHHVARSGSIDLLNIILDESCGELKPIKNIFQQTCKDVAEVYGHKECGKAIQDRFLP